MFGFGKEKSPAKTCAHCGKKIGALTGEVPLIGGYLCGDCYRILPEELRNEYWPLFQGKWEPRITYEQLDEIIRSHAPAFEVDCESFEQDLSFNNGVCEIQIDIKRKIMRYPTAFLKGELVWRYIDMSYIIGCEFINEDYSSSTMGAKGAVLGGAAGYVVAGPAGGAVGLLAGQNANKKNTSLVAEMGAMIHTKDPKEPSIFFSFVVPGTNKGDRIYAEKADDARSFVFQVKSLLGLDKKEIIVNSQSDADEIRKYKALLDEGIISQEEFEAKKKQLLGL